MSDALAGEDLKRAALARLRFESSMGVDILPRVALTPSTARPPAESEEPIAAASASSSSSAAAPKASSSGGLTDFSALTPEEREERWRNLEARAKACSACGLAKTRNSVVFGDGSKTAQIVFVGEGPGADEDAQGLPFVGRAGQLLNKIIEAMKIKRQDVYICNIVKCRPPENRQPLPDEVAACNAFLEEQIALIKPKVIVCLGGPATKTLLKTAQGIMSIRGRWFAYKGIPVMPTYHPAFVLRSYTEENRRAVWEDMKKVLEKVKA
jgi:uracil-DNA glycosylase family 4